MPPKPTNTEGRVPVHVVPKEATRLARQRMAQLVQMVPDRPLYMALHEDTVALALQAALPALEDSFKERVREAAVELMLEVHKEGLRARGGRIGPNNEAEARASFQARFDAALDSEDHRG